MRIFLVLLFCISVYANQTITDISKWDHPTKALFKSAGISIQGVQLIHEGKYPVFTVKSSNPLDVNSSNPLWTNIALANGWWNYSVITEGRLVQVECSKEKRNVRAVYPLNSVSFLSRAIIPNGVFMVTDKGGLTYKGISLNVLGDEFADDEVVGVSIVRKSTSQITLLVKINQPSAMANHEVYKTVILNLSEGYLLSWKTSELFGDGATFYSVIRSDTEIRLIGVESYVGGYDENGNSNSTEVPDSYVEYLVDSDNSVTLLN